MTTTLDKDSTIRGADKKEAFHRAAEKRAESFSFKRPDEVELVDQKAVYYLAESDICGATVQIIPEGGDNNMHYHPDSEGFWMVLQGRIRFHGPDGVIGEYGQHEGLLMPRNCRYWFESADPSTELHLLHIDANSRQKVKNGRIDLGPRRKEKKPNMRLSYPADHRLLKKKA